MKGAEKGDRHQIKRTPDPFILPWFVLSAIAITSLSIPHASCLFREFALFYAKLTSAGSPDPVTSLDWVMSLGWFSPA